MCMPVTSAPATETADLRALLAQLEAMPRVDGMWDSVKRTVVKTKDKYFVNRGKIKATLDELIQAQKAAETTKRGQIPRDVMNRLKIFQNDLDADFDQMQKKQYVETLLLSWYQVRPGLQAYQNSIDVSTADSARTKRCIGELVVQMQLYENRWRKELPNLLGMK